jgi:tRNA nucleotidyltransferase (CCA-adding enzyme)
MTPLSSDAYLRGVLARHSPAVDSLTISTLRALLEPGLRRWGERYLRDIRVSGSNAKGTAVGGQTDVDFFLSIGSDAPATLREIYWSLHQRAADEGWFPRAQNVSIGIQFASHKIDLVPARVQSGYANRHSLYRRKADT